MKNSDLTPYFRLKQRAEELISSIGDECKKHDIRNTPKEWVGRQDELIQKISEWDPSKCLERYSMCIDALTYLFGGQNPVNEKVYIVFADPKVPKWGGLVLYWRDLLHHANTKNYGKLDEISQKNSNTNLVLGYILIQDLLINRINLYLEQSPIERAALNVANSNYLIEHGFSNLIDESLAKVLVYPKFKELFALAKTSDGIKSLSDSEKLILSKINEILGKEILKTLGQDSIHTQIVRCCLGEDNIKYIARRVELQHNKDLKHKGEQEKFEDEILLTLDMPRYSGKEESLSTYKDEVRYDEDVFFNPENLLIALQNQKIISEAIELSELTQKQRTVIDKHFFQCKSYQEIAEELGKEESCIRDHCRLGLKKIFKYVSSKHPETFQS